MKQVWLTIPEAAEHLNVTERWLRRQIADSKIRYRKLGALIHFNVHDLDQLSDESMHDAERPLIGRNPEGRDGGRRRRHRTAEADVA